MHYLAIGCEELHQIILSHAEPSAAILADIFMLACNTFRQLAKDERFFAAHAELVDRRLQNQEEFAQIAQPDQLQRRFKSLESKILTQAGLSDATIRRLFDKVFDLPEQLQQPSLQQEELIAHVNALRDEACPLATALRQRRKTRPAEQEPTDQLDRYGYALGGATMIYTGASALAASLGFCAPGSAVSGAAGAALIAHSLPPR